MKRKRNLLLGVLSMIIAFWMTGSALANGSDEYVLPYSARGYLTRQDVAQLSLQELNYARNEIYARHGRGFKSVELQNYFYSKTWYICSVSPDNFDYSCVSAVEAYNAGILQEEEYSRNPDGYILDQPGYNIGYVGTYPNIGNYPNPTPEPTPSPTPSPIDFDMNQMLGSWYGTYQGGGNGVTLIRNLTVNVTGVYGTSFTATAAADDPYTDLILEWYLNGSYDTASHQVTLSFSGWINQAWNNSEMGFTGTMSTTNGLVMSGNTIADNQVSGNTFQLTKNVTPISDATVMLGSWSGSYEGITNGEVVIRNLDLNVSSVSGNTFFGTLSVFTPGDSTFMEWNVEGTLDSGNNVYLKHTGWIIKPGTIADMEFTGVLDVFAMSISGNPIADGTNTGRGFWLRKN